MILGVQASRIWSAFVGSFAAVLLPPTDLSIKAPGRQVRMLKPNLEAIQNGSSSLSTDSQTNRLMTCLARFQAVHLAPTCQGLPPSERVSATGFSMQAVPVRGAT
jgi:hypothetical protein